MKLLLPLFVRYGIPKVARHAMIVIGSWLANHGYHGPSDFGSILMGVAMIAGSVLWSLIARTNLNGWLREDDIRGLLEICARAAISAIASFMSIPPEQLTSMSGEAFFIVGLNIVISMISDTKHAPKAQRLR